LIKGFPTTTTTTTTTTKQNVDPAVYYVYSRVKKFISWIIDLKPKIASYFEKVLFNKKWDYLQIHRDRVKIEVLVEDG
jgi:hypothetical protein